MNAAPAATRITRRQWVALGLALGLGGWLAARPARAAEPFVERLADRALIAQLRQGGYVLYLRHGTTDNSRADRVPDVDLHDCSTQRLLNDAGRALAVRLGGWLRQARIPVAEVLHSPMCRTRETAQLAFPALRAQLREEPSLMTVGNLSSVQKEPVLVALRTLIARPPAAGGNRVLVGHAPNLADLMGYFVKPEGTLVVLRPLGGERFDYVASVPPTLWPELLR